MIFRFYQRNLKLGSSFVSLVPAPASSSNVGPVKERKVSKTGEKERKESKRVSFADQRNQSRSCIIL